MSGTLLLVLRGGSDRGRCDGHSPAVKPKGTIMLAKAMVSLVINATVIRMLTRFRRGEVHLRAAWLSTRADLVGNIGVIFSAILVFLTGSRFPDPIVGWRSAVTSSGKLSRFFVSTAGVY